MSKLIQMRQRIKAIETIKKITQAMRLISMSSHSRLKHKQEPLSVYLENLTTLFAKLYSIIPQWKNPIISPEKPMNTNPLIILVGSQKGLCGSFNSSLYKEFNKYFISHESKEYSFIAVGKKAEEFLKEHYPNQLIQSFTNFNARNFLLIAQELIDHIEHKKEPYTLVRVMSNQFKSFFIQQPEIHTLIPFNPESIQQKTETQTESYIWDQQPEAVLSILSQEYLGARFQYILFQSLLAEHAARFVSMDNSTRNAENLLEQKELEYNKLRQAKITTELTELSGSF